MISLGPLTLLVALGVCGAFAADGDELKAVIVLYRHGDRAPLSSWPNDIYFGNSSLWPDGYGQLNNMGKERHYRLGQWFRERYDGFLPRRYNRNDIYVRSTDVDRTLMSAASNLAGLYPPEGDQVWNSAIPWQAIPIHTMPTDQDPILAVENPCPKHDQLQVELERSAEFTQFYADNAKLFQNISEVSGFPYGSLDLGDFEGIYSAITIYRGFNLSLPAWTDYYWPEISALAAKSFQVPTYTQALARLRTGPFFDYILNHLYSVKNQTDVPKCLALSAHDSTISARTNAMGVYPDAVPSFASTVIWELKGKSNGDVYINMYFKNTTDFNPLTLPGCNFDCDLDKYAEILKPITVDVEQWEEECYDL